MNRLRISVAVLALVMWFTAGLANGGSAQELYDKAMEVAHPAILNPDHAAALQYLDSALQYDPEHVPSRNMRVIILMQLHRFEEAAVDVEALYEVTKLPQTKLLYCMVSEHLMRGTGIPTECYLRAAQLYRAEPGGDEIWNFGYLVSLKMAQTDEFDAAMAAALAEVGEDEEIWGPGLVHLDILYDDRETLLHEHLGLGTH